MRPVRKGEGVWGGLAYGKEQRPAVRRVEVIHGLFFEPEHGVANLSLE
jgi:hypothetical protein